MAKTIVDPLSDEQYKYTIAQCNMVRTALFDLNQDELTFKLSGLSQLQLLLDKAPIESVTLSALSIAFSEIFLENNPEYRWVCVKKEDEHPDGRLAIQYLSSLYMWYPEEAFAKAQGKQITVRHMYLELLQHLRKKINDKDLYIN